MEDSKSTEHGDAGFIKLSHRPLNLADQKPANYVSTEDATPWIALALSTAKVVEWPDDLHVTLADPDGITIPKGTLLRAGSGATALIRHAGPGFKVYGSLEGLTIHRPARANSINDAAVWVMPNSTDVQVTDVVVTGGHTAGIVVGGSAETIEGTAVDATLANIRVGDMTGASSYGYRVDSSRGLTMLNCRSDGAELDNIKFRSKAQDPRIIGGRFAHSRGGDGLDGFAGMEGGFIGGGVIFEDNGINNIVIKTDMLEAEYPGIASMDGKIADSDAARLAVADQIARFGLPKQVNVQGVICRRAKAGGVTFHRSDASDSDYSAGWPMPWLADVNVSGLLIESPGGVGLHINVFNGLFSGIQILNAGSTGLHVNSSARQIRLNQVAIRGAGSKKALAGLARDGVVLQGEDIWLSQVFVDGVQAGNRVDEGDIATAEKLTRIGFNSTTEAVAKSHHFSQCASARVIAAGLSNAARDHAVHLDGVYGTSEGTSVGGVWLRGSAGELEVSSTGTEKSWRRVGNRMVTLSQLADAKHPVNTTGKAHGVQAFVLENNKTYTATAAAAGSTWVEPEGSFVAPV